MKNKALAVTAGKLGLGSLATKVDKSQLRLIEEEIWPQKSFFSADTPVVKEGTIIVRPVRAFNTERREPLPVDFKITGEEKKTYIFKASLSNLYFTENFVTWGHDKKGLVCFCNVDVPENWVAFKVIKVGKEGKSVEVTPIVTDLDTLLADYYKIPPPVANKGVIKKLQVSK